MPNVVRVPSLRLTELDGSPDVQAVERIYLTNGYLSSLGGGAVLLSMSGTPSVPVYPITTPVDSGFSWLNQGSASTTTTNGAVFLSAPASATTEFRGRIKAKTAPYTITASMLPLFSPANFARVGLFFTDGTKIAFFGVGYNANPRLFSSTFNTVTSINADYTTQIFSGYSGMLWLRIADNNTNRVCSLSMDGINFIEIHSVVRTDFLTATSVGWGGDVENSVAWGSTLLSWSEA